MSKGQTHCNSCEHHLTAAELCATPVSGVLVCQTCARLSSDQRRDGWQPGMQWDQDGREGLRLASRADVPWSHYRVSVISICKDGTIRSAHGLEAKRELLRETPADGMLLVAWPGSWHQDVFVVDDRKAALAALAPKSRSA